jgi:hypothetical protein
VRDDDFGDVANQPTAVVESPHEVDVFAGAKGLIEAVAETAPTHEQAGAWHVVDRRIGDHERSSLAHVQGAEAFLKAVTYRRTIGASNSRGDGTFERVCKMCLQSRQHLGGIIEDDVDVDEPEQRTRRSASSGIASAAGSHIGVEAHDVCAESLGATKDIRGVIGRVVDDGGVQSIERFQKFFEGANVVMHRDHDVDVVDVRDGSIQGVKETLLHEGPRESFFADLDFAAVDPAFCDGPRPSRKS